MNSRLPLGPPIHPTSRERLGPERSRGGPSDTHEPANLVSRIAQLREQAPRRVANPREGQSSRPRAAVGGVPQASEPRSRAPESPKIPRRKSRNVEPAQAIGLRLRPEERQLLTDIGKFRVISASDLARFLYNDNHAPLRRDLDYLRQQNLIEIHVLNARRDGRGGDVRRFQAVTLTDAGQRLVRDTAELTEGQRLYSGLVKRREAEHDCQVYAAYQKELGSLTQAGARNVRVQLDFELKANFNRALYLARKAQPGTEVQQLKEQVAAQFQLQMNHRRLMVPDARIEYDLPGGGHGQIEIEVATAAYRQGHLASKAQAGFKLYMSHGDIGRLGAAVQDDHDLMSEILDL